MSVGLLSRVLLLPLAPVEGVIWIADRIREIAEQELNDPAVLRRQLADAAEALERGELTEDEYDEFEEYVLERLMDAPMSGGGVA